MLMVRGYFVLLVLDEGETDAGIGVDLFKNAATLLMHFPLVTPTYSSALLRLPE